VIGVELVPALAAIGNKLLENESAKFRTNSTEIIIDNACLFSIPSDASIAYFYNPFSLEIFSHVIKNIEKSLKKKPRTFTLVLLHMKPDAIDICKKAQFIVGKKCILDNQKLVIMINTPLNS
jgi:hypothetical protein